MCVPKSTYYLHTYRITAKTACAIFIIIIVVVIYDLFAEKEERVNNRIAMQAACAGITSFVA